MFEYYIENFKGIKIPDKNSFIRTSKIAFLYIKRAVCTEIEEKDVKDAICAISDILYENADSSGIKSEKTDTLSVTYSDNRMEKLINNAIRLYVPSQLLYRGI